MKHKKRLPVAEMDVGKVSFRFWLRTKKIRSGCIEWQGACDSEGYARTSVFHRDFRASRLAFFLFHGIDPGDKLVLHRCDNPQCVNPHHLFLGTQKDNIQDIDEKGRRTTVHLRGEKSGRAILVEKEVRHIRKSEKTISQLARKYGVSRGCIGAIRQRLNWRHVK